MCGIAGLMRFDGRPPAEDLLDRLEQALSHRGPDGTRRHITGGTGLIHRRLAIIDLQTGDQPFVVKDGAGDVALVANGEIYNYRALRAAMPDVAFATQSDCEPVLHLYRRHGAAFARNLRGMYALAISDEAAGRLVLARDPFGIKPLDDAETSQGFSFASEPQALLRAGIVSPYARGPACAQLLQQQFTTNRETIFAGVQRVLPGETIVIENGRIVERQRIEALPAGAPGAVGEEDALRALDAILAESVGLHQQSDVPYGMFLSGGVDSATVLALMKRLNAAPVQAFTAFFPGTAAADERERARVAARAAGADHHEVEVTEADGWRLLPQAAAALDDPAADYAILPSLRLAQVAREAGLKVILTGEGGDELFAGYGRYRRAMRWRLFGGRPMRAKGVFDGLGILRHARAARNEPSDATGTGQPERSRLQVNQAIDCADWLPNDLLIKLDRCLMACGVEGRVPFLDPEVAKFAFLLPDALKIRGGFGKWLLRRWLQTALPEAEPFARKQGFTVPVGEWIAAQARRLGPLVAAQHGVAEACHPGSVEALFDRLDRGRVQAAWRLLFYAVWHRVHLEGVTPSGDVFEVLGG